VSDRHTSEERRSMGVRRQANHLAVTARRRFRVDEIEISRLPAKTVTVVHDLCRHLHSGVIKEDHELSEGTKEFDVSKRYFEVARIRSARTRYSSASFGSCCSGWRWRSMTSWSARAAGPVKRRASACRRQLSIADWASAAMASLA